MRRALERDGWTITHDPLRLRWGAKDLYVDLGAEQILAAEKASVLLTKKRLRLVVIDGEQEEIRRWTPENPTAR